MKVLALSVIYFVTICNGRPTSRIAGGNVRPISQHPYVVPLLNNLEGGSYRQLCGGTILSNNAILSAASCFFTGTSAHDAFSWRARVGSSYANKGGLVYIVRRITTHPDFESITKVNDIAVLRTTLNVVYGVNVQSIYLPGTNYQLPSGAAVKAVGWGVTRANGDLSPELREVEIWVSDQATCASRYSELGFTITDNMLCAGGPLVHNNVVVGVYSWSEGCAGNRYTGINTRVASYNRWIESVAIAP
ncbi:unnamed protein product, partial [Leptidea sinapis]